MGVWEVASQLQCPHERHCCCHCRVEPSDLLLPERSLDELLGQICLREMEDGQQMCATVSRKIAGADVANHREIL